MWNDRAAFRLGAQEREIIEVMTKYRQVGSITRQYATSGAPTFVVRDCGGIDEDIWDSLEETLANQLEMSRVELTLQGSNLVIAPRPHATLDLLPLLEHDLMLSNAQSLIGVDRDGRPVKLSMYGRNAEHVLFLGGSGAGKTAALRACAVSLAVSSRQSQVQMIFVAPEGGSGEIAGPGLGLLHYLPHALSAVVSSVNDVADVLAFVTEEMQYRRSHAVNRPSIVLFIDDLEQILRNGGGPVREPLRAILADGIQNGIFVVMAAGTEQEESGLSDLFALKPVLHIVGNGCERARSPQFTAALCRDAQYLGGRGEFLLATEMGGRVFQTAFVDRIDLHWCLERLQEKRQIRLLARRFA